MPVPRIRTLSLTAFALVAALAWVLPAAAQETGPEPLALPTEGSCTPDFLRLPVGDDPVPAQTCGPCILSFCGAAYVRCDFSHCDLDDCCVYNCMCDPSCLSGSIPGNVCARLPLFCCGNAEQEPTEQCDGEDLGGKTCASLGLIAGTLACDSMCDFDTSGCTCGNGTQEDPEECDGTDLDGTTCEDLGFDGGTLACTGSCIFCSDNCAFDTSGCFTCGNDICEAGEDCESCPEDCEGKSTGPPSGRFCCGNGEMETAEGDGTICDFNF